MISAAVLASPMEVLACQGRMIRHIIHSKPPMNVENLECAK